MLPKAIKAGRSAPRAALAAWTPLIVGVLTAGLAVAGLTDLAWRRFSPEQAALGEQTRAYFGSEGFGRIHCTDRRDQARCLAAYQAAGHPLAVLWLGNSQLHGVNRYASGQQTAPMRLHQALAPRGLYAVAFSEPNANLTEHRQLFRELQASYDIRTLILPVCLDDFRETGIRDTLIDAPSSAAQPSLSLQAKTEDRLEQALADRSQAWQRRGLVKSMFYYALYQVRNRALGVTSQTKRPVPAPLYAEKMATLNAILAEAHEAQVRVILYVPPYRSDIPGPYDEAQYARFRADLRALAKPGAVEVLDLTDIVPGPEWGLLKDSLFGFVDYDFMHFTAEGHRRLEERVLGAF